MRTKFSHALNLFCPGSACNICVRLFPNDRNNSASTLLLGCFFAVLYICIWHGLGSFPALIAFHEVISRGGQILSYAGHAFLMFSVGLFCRFALDRSPKVWLSSDYLRWLSRIVLMYWISLCLFWLLGIVNRSQSLLGIGCINILLAKDIPTLWFVQVIILFLLFAPMFLAGSTVRRVAGVVAFLGVLGVLKLKNQWLDIRIFELLPTFLMGACLFEFRLLRYFLDASWVLVLALLILPVCIWSYGNWYDEALVASACRMLAMAVGIVTIWRLSMSIPHTKLPAFLWPAGASWLGVFLLHRPIARLSGVLTLDVSYAGSWFMLFGFLVPITFFLSILFHRLFARSAVTPGRSSYCPLDF